MAGEWWASDPNALMASSGYPSYSNVDPNNPLSFGAGLPDFSQFDFSQLPPNFAASMPSQSEIDASSAQYRRDNPSIYDTDLPYGSPEYMAKYGPGGTAYPDLPKGGTLFDALVGNSAGAIFGAIKDDPSRIFTGLDPISTGISNAVLGQNNAPITNSFGSPSATSYENYQAANPDKNLTDSRTISSMADLLAGGIGGAFAAPALLGAYSGAANTISNGGGALLGDAGPVTSGLSAAGSAAGTVASSAGTLPAVVVNGSGGILNGLSTAGGIAGGVGQNIVNSQTQQNQQPVPQLDPVTVTGSPTAPVPTTPPPSNNNTDWLNILKGVGGVGIGAGLANLSSPGGTSSGSNNSMGFNWTDLIGPLLNLAGGAVGQNAANQGSEAAIKLAQQGSYPYNVNLPGYGQSTFDPINRTASLNPDGSLANFQQQGNNLSQQGYNGLTGLLGSPYGQGGYGGISPQLQQQFGQAQGSQYRNPTSNVFGSPQVFSGLLNQSGQTAQNLYGQVGQGLPSTSGATSYLNAGQGFLNNATGFNLPGQEATNLQRLRSQAQFGESQAQQNNLENQFGKGVLASTAGGYQTQGLNQALQTADVQRQQLAHQMALGDQSQMLQNSVGASNAGYGYLQGIQGLQGGQLNQANQALGGYQNLQQTGYGQSFANNSYGNDTTNQAFQQAMSLFGTGMNSQQQQFGQQNQAYNQGQANSLNIGGYLQGLLGLGGNLGALSSGASGTAAGIAANQGVNNGNMYAGLFNNLGSSVNWGSLFGSNPSATPK